MGLIEYMVKQLRDIKGAGIKKYWTVLQWKQLYEEFDLGFNIKDALDAPPAGEHIRDDLLFALEAPQSKTLQQGHQSLSNVFLKSARR